MGLQFGKLAAVDFGIQLIGWIFSATLRTEKFYDLTGTCHCQIHRYQRFPMDNSSRFLDIYAFDIPQSKGQPTNATSKYSIVLHIHMGSTVRSPVGVGLVQTAILNLLERYHPRLNLLMMRVCSFRLGTFLFYRILKTGKDRRFDRMRNSPLRLLFAWMMQGWFERSTNGANLHIRYLWFLRCLGHHDALTNLVFEHQTDR